MGREGEVECGEAGCTGMERGGVWNIFQPRLSLKGSERIKMSDIRGNR